MKEKIITLIDMSKENVGHLAQNQDWIYWSRIVGFWILGIMIGIVVLGAIICGSILGIIKLYEIWQKKKGDKK